MKLDTQSLDESVLPFIDGGVVPSRSETLVEVTNPSCGRPLIQIPGGCSADVDRAVLSARSSFKRGDWSASPPSMRKRVLHRWADLIEAQATALDALDAGEMGKPVSEKRANAAAAAELVRFNAEAVDKVLGDVYGCDRFSSVSQRRVPRGVVAAVIPWNFPTYNALLKLAPALAAGNSVVLKPSELASRSSIRLAQLAMQAGVPEGVLNIVPGLGQTVGQMLGRHVDVDMLTFTGSTAIGKQMLQYSGQSNMKVILTECGGKSPQIVFDDGVDIDRAADAIASLLLTNQGQLCSVGSRLLVQRSIQDRVIARITQRFDEIRMGDALSQQTTFGPLASAKQCERVMNYINGASHEGAKLVKGGRRALESTGGYFVEPTIFSEVRPAARVAQEEIFGPVLAVMSFADEAEAIEIANGTMYGLAAYVWTGNLSRAMRMTKCVHSSIWVNATVPTGEGAGHAASFESVGQSGLGIEGGLAGLESYLRRQIVWINHD